MGKTGVIVILLVAQAALPCRADTTLREDGREIGQDFRKFGKDTGTAFKEGGRKVGEGFRKFGNEAGTAIKEGGRESGQAAKKAGRSMGDWFRDLGHSIKSYFNDRSSTTR